MKRVADQIAGRPTQCPLRVICHVRESEAMAGKREKGGGGRASRIVGKSESSVVEMVNKVELLSQPCQVSEVVK